MSSSKMTAAEQQTNKQENWTTIVLLKTTYWNNKYFIKFIKSESLTDVEYP